MRGQDEQQEGPRVRGAKCISQRPDLGQSFWRLDEEQVGTGGGHRGIHPVCPQGPFLNLRSPLEAFEAWPFELGVGPSGSP